jgi:2-hydroxychromene-2-carboxylate isomerase
MEPVFYFDFGSPNAYLAHRLIPGVEARTGIRFRYVPVLLGGLFKLSGNQAPMLAFAGVPNKLAYERREIERFIERHRLEAFRMNAHFPVNTLMLMRGAVAARAEGVFDPYVEAIFRGMWEQSLKLDDPSVLMAALVAAGLPSDSLLARAQGQDVKDELAASTQEAYERGAFGIPSFLVGTELYFGKDRLRDVEEELVRGSPAS